jgi:WD40 repeat protein
MSVAFDDQLIVSGCSQSVVRLWSMDELKSIKALRHHQGAVTALQLHNGMPLSGGEDGTVAAWDGSGVSSNPVVSWEVGGPVGAMAIADNSGEWAQARVAETVSIGQRGLVLELMKSSAGPCICFWRLF